MIQRQFQEGVRSYSCSVTGVASQSPAIRTQLLRVWTNTTGLDISWVDVTTSPCEFQEKKPSVLSKWSSFTVHVYQCEGLW